MQSKSTLNQNNFWDGQECVGHSYSYVAHFVRYFERCLDSNPEINQNNPVLQ